MIIQELKGHAKIWDNVTQTTVAQQLMRVMRNHIGRKNAISKRDLFQKLFGKEYNSVSFLNRGLLDKYFHRATSFCRSKTNCFIINDYIDSTSVYYVIADGNDLAVYQDTTQRWIRGLKKLQKRAKKSVEKGWYEQEWRLDRDGNK